MAKNINELDPICHNGNGVSKTLVTSAELYSKIDEDEFPFREPNLSRFEFSLIAKVNSATGVVVFNIPAKELNEIKLKTDIAVNYLMTRESQNQPAGSPAYTTRLTLTKFKGRTAADVLLENPENEKTLLEGKAWLEANLKNPSYAENNKKQIEAIDDALALLNAEKLSKEGASASGSGKVLTIYKRDHKYKSTKDANGNNLVYSISITCDTSRDKPFVIEVSNCFAPLMPSANGQVVPKMSNAIGTKRSSISLSDSEWICLLGQAFDLYQNFKTIHAPAAFKKVAAHSYSLKQNS